VTRVGISLPGGGASGAGLAPTGLADAARQIEAAGFESAWTFDAIVRGWLLPDPLTALAVAATVTSKIELGTGIFQVPLRHPVELAQRVLTTHLVSGGRLLFGVGAGSTASDFAALGLEFPSRFRRLDESLKIMRQLWDGANASTACRWRRCGRRLPAGLGCSSGRGRARGGSCGRRRSSTAGSAPARAAAGGCSARASRASVA
jgi:alkanesulfonate monooxygenase SsuD/methylene tetrahydromethanopterin reductase-like flavin-dependent oxidoreductase (luciferase family)